jgi:serine protease Do
LLIENPHCRAFHSTIKIQQSKIQGSKHKLIPIPEVTNMRKYVLASIVVLPFLLGISWAEQNWSTEQGTADMHIFSSEDSGTSSYLGVDIADVTTERMSALKLKEEKGVEVTMVDQDAPAGKAGIKEHDVIMTMNGTAVDSGAQLRRMIHETPPGRLVTFGLSRDGQPVTVKVQLGDKHKEYSGPDMKDWHIDVPEVHVPDIDIPSINMIMVTTSARSGLMIENITPQLGEFFGVKNGNGVLVRSVEKGSRAEKAGFRAGDVIVKVNDQPVHDTSDFSHAVKARSGDSVGVGVIRDKKEQNLNLTLPERKESGQIEESLDGAEIGAESRAEMSELREEMAKLQPQMDLARETARKAAEDARKTMCSEQRKMSEEIRKQADEQREKFRAEEQKLRREMEKMEREMRRAWLDI